MALSLFDQGTSWIRADFHLHTKADKEFSFKGDDNAYVGEYIDALVKAGIQLGVITNHNKFDLNEFKLLRKKARKQDIGLLPGVELSVKDGQAGIHTLVVFSDAWFSNKENENYIQSFLSTTFSGQANFEQENARSNHDLINTIRELDKFEKDYFIVFAHVEADNGLWGGMKPGIIGDLFKNDVFKQRVLGFQKVRTRDERDKIYQNLNGHTVAEIEGSDPKSIEQIGKGNHSFLKLGGVSYDAVKFALFDHQNRVSFEPPAIKHSFIRKISFEGVGTLGGESVSFSPELNTLIGIRGSGKSSVLEAVRYALNIPFGDKAVDTTYKNNLVHHLLSNGGKIVIDAVDRHGLPYQVNRIFNKPADVLVNGVIQPGVSIRETVLHKPIYFGQKDLSSSGEGFEKDLIEKLLGDSLIPIRQDIAAQKQAVVEVIRQLKKLSNDKQKKQEWQQKKQDAEFSLKIYQDSGVEEKLQKQIEFDHDERKFADAIQNVNRFYLALKELLDEHRLPLQAIQDGCSKENHQFFDEFKRLYQPVIEQFNLLDSIANNSNKLTAPLDVKLQQFKELKQANKEAFAEIERKLSAELKEKGIQTLRIDDFRRIKSRLDQAGKVLQVLEQSDKKHQQLRDSLTDELSKLESLRETEFNQIQAKINKVNHPKSPLTIKAEYKSDSDATFEYMQTLFKGSRFHGGTMKGLIKKYIDFVGMRAHWDALRKEMSKYETFNQYFQQNIEELLTWQVPNKFTIEYHGKALQHHSLGQRASALMLFVLGQQDNDVVMIDQPEDDLDNQTIYDDVIKLLRKLKPSTQFIFATHNANIPVLGDAEQVVCCHYEDQKTTTITGSIDNTQIQQHIVSIMEGGREAFEKRKQVYEAWKP